MDRWMDEIIDGYIYVLMSDKLIVKWSDGYMVRQIDVYLHACMHGPCIDGLG